MLDDSNEEIDIKELETFIINNNTDIDIEVNYIIYVSKKTLNNGFENFRTIKEAIKYITELNKHEYLKQFQINLLPGVYEESFILPSYININGSGKEITKINLSSQNDFISMCSDTSISNLSICFDNLLEVDNIILLDINSRNNDSKLQIQKKNIESNNILSYEVDKNKYFTSNKIRLHNVSINVDNFVSGYIINIANGKLELSDCQININSSIRNTEIDLDNKDLEMEELQEINQIHDIDFRYIKVIKVDISQLNIINSNISLETDIEQAYILSCELSKITLNNSNLTLNNNNYSKFFLENNYLILNTFSSINAHNSSLSNKRHLGKILLLDQDNFLGKEQILNNLSIKDNKIRIKTLLQSVSQDKILLASDGFLFENKKYIFSNRHILDDEIVLDIHVLSDEYENVELLTNIKIQYLYKLDIYNCLLEENCIDSDFVKNTIFPENYIVSVFNTNIICKKFCGLINKNLNNDNILSGSSIDLRGNINTCKNIYSDKIVSDGTLLDNVGAKKYYNYENEVYSLLYKPEKLGHLSIDFSYPMDFNLLNEYPIINYKNFGSLGNLSFTSGYKNLSEGDLSFSLGYNCHSFGFGSFSCGLATYTYDDFGFTIGKYNTNYNINKNRLFTIGNGLDNYDRSDALVVYDDGRMQVKKSILCDTFTDGISYLSNGNLLGINTLESENIIVDEDINLEGDLLGKKGINDEYSDYVSIDILSTFAKKITSIKLDIGNLQIPNYGKIIGLDDKLCTLYNFNNNENGMIYQIEITCIEETEIDIGFLISQQYDELKLGANIEEWNEYDINKNIVIFNKKMKRGDRLKKEFDSCLIDDFSLYIFNNKLSDETYIKDGKFILTFTGDFF